MLIKFCICIDKNKMHVVSIARFFFFFFLFFFCFFLSFLTELLPLIDFRIVFYARYLVYSFVNFDQILYMH